MAARTTTTETTETTAGTGAPKPRLRIEPGPKRVRAYVGGVAIADTVQPLYVWEKPYYPTYYVPLADVRTDSLEETPTVTHSPSRGDATHFTVRVGTEARVDAAQQYRTSPIEELRDHVRFDWDAIDAWFEEDEEVFTHPRNPYTRVDILPTSRQVRVEMRGVVVADSPRALVLFETGLRPRFYVPKVDVHLELLVHTDEVSHCPYKGQAEYWSVRVGDAVEENVAWSYRTPLPECERIAGYVCFYDERLDVYVGGVRQERPARR
jgi:uncharacterized protein (DUF427 family)